MRSFKNLSVFALLVTLLVQAAGCHRSYYRRQADADAHRLIEEKSLDPHWSIPGYTIEMDPSSRMFDPFSADHPPMPPDDPSAAEFMNSVDGKPGFPHWHANGDTPHVANPEWRYMLPTDKDGKLVADINLAVELALLHSPEYQRQLENLYLSALAVSLERFDFESQFFAPFNSTLTNSGRIRGGGNSSTTLASNNGVGTQLRKAGITGSNLVVGFANSILWQYSGGDSTVGFGSLSLELIQPLLRNAGRDVILESLTDAERGLLYNVRQLERYRRGYMQQIAVGMSNGGGVSVGSGSIAGVSGVSRGAGGALGLLQTQQNIRIQEANIASQRSLLEQFEEFYKFQRIDLLQLKQFRNSVYGSQSGLLSSKANYQSSLDDFKITLGLPPDVELEIADPILNQFVLIDEKITNRQDEVSVLRDTASAIFLDITEIIAQPIEQMKLERERMLARGGDPQTDLSWTSKDIPFDQPIRDGINRARATLEKIEPIYQKIVAVDFPQTDQDIDRLNRSLQRRRKSLLELQKKLDEKSKSYQSGTPAIEPEVLDTQVLKTLVGERRVEFEGGIRINDEGERETVRGVQKNVEISRKTLQIHLVLWDLILANEGKLPQSFLTPLLNPADSVADPDKRIGQKLRALSNKLKSLPPKIRQLLPERLREISQESFDLENRSSIPAGLESLLPDLIDSIFVPIATQKDIAELKAVLTLVQASRAGLLAAVSEEEAKEIEPILRDVDTALILLEDENLSLFAIESIENIFRGIDRIRNKLKMVMNEEDVSRISDMARKLDDVVKKIGRIRQQWQLILEELDRVPDPLKSLILIGGDSNLKTDMKTRADIIKRFVSEPGPEVLTILNNLIIDVSLIQALARVDSLTLPIVDIKWQNALEIARSNRRDWMNARAQLVDQWRNIEVVADTLESQLDLTFGGDLQNTGNNPFKLRDRNGQIRVGLQFDAPITRLAERNNYRSALITYQRTRRTFYQYEDQISAQIREIIRLLEVVKLNFEISRIQVKNSVDEVQLASYNLVRPPAPGSTSSRVGGQTANNLIRALGNLLNNQNALIRNWVEYEVLRRQLDFNMGTMRLDENGFWVDPVEITLESIEQSLSGDYIPGISPEGGPQSGEQPMDPLPPVGDPQANRFPGDRGGFSGYRSTTQRGGENRFPGTNHLRERGRFTETSNFTGTTSGELVTYPERAQAGAGSGKVFRSSESLIAGRPPKRKTDTRSLYSNFDRDRKVSRPGNRAEADSTPRRTATRIRTRKIVDRRVNRATHDQEQAPPRIAPFPFQLKN